jgi:hypothetical protein
MYTFFWLLLFILLLYVFRERVEMFTVFPKGSDLRDVLTRYYDDTVALKGIVDINNSVASVVVQRAGVLFLDKVWFDESNDILDHAQVSESTNDFMTFEDYDKLFENVKQRFEGRVVVGVIRLVTEGSVTVVVYDESNNDKNQVYDLTFDKDTLIVRSDRFLNIEFSKPVVELGEKPQYVYDFKKFVLLLKNIHTYFARDARTPHGTIRLTKDILTVIVIDPKTYASIVYDVHYNHETMGIRNVVRSDMTFVLSSTSDIHRLIKKSDVL